MASSTAWARYGEHPEVLRVAYSMFLHRTDTAPLAAAVPQ
jgi:hypothetical protein